MLKLVKDSINTLDIQGSTEYLIFVNEVEVGIVRLITTDNKNIKIDLILIEEEYQRKGYATQTIDYFKKTYPKARFFGEVLDEENYTFWQSIVKNLRPYEEGLHFEFFGYSSELH